MTDFAETDRQMRELRAQLQAATERVRWFEEHNQHFRNHDTGQIECQCCEKWALDAIEEKKALQAVTKERDALKRNRDTYGPKVVAKIRELQTQLQAVTKERDEFKGMYEGLCK